MMKAIPSTRARKSSYPTVSALFFLSIIGAELKKLSEKDNAFLGAWGAVAVTSMTALRQPNPNVRLILAPFSAFDSERQLVDHPELVLAVWLYSFYTTIFTSEHGTIPAGILGIASLGIGLSVGEAKGMV